MGAALPGRLHLPPAGAARPAWPPRPGPPRRAPCACGRRPRSGHVRQPDQHRAGGPLALAGAPCIPRRAVAGRACPGAARPRVHLQVPGSRSAVRRIGAPGDALPRRGADWGPAPLGPGVIVTRASAAGGEQAAAGRRSVHPANVQRDYGALRRAAQWGRTRGAEDAAACGAAPVRLSFNGAARGVRKSRTACRPPAQRKPCGASRMQKFISVTRASSTWPASRAVPNLNYTHARLMSVACTTGRGGAAPARAAGQGMLRT